MRLDLQETDMKLRTSAAAVLLAAAAPLAWAQDQPSPAPQFGPLPPPAPAEANTNAPADLAASPVASAAASLTSDELANAIVQDLVADSSLQGSKITVASEDGVITLTGVATKRAQSKRASEIAAARAGEGKVINAIATEEF